ncbi:MAG: peptidoglycan-binding protein [Patescibacteria group bacterium]
MNFKNTRFAFSTGVVAMALLLAGSPLSARAETLTRQLELGMSGSDVSTLQVFLAKDATIYPQGLVTGYFGSLTKSAVSNFQARNNVSTVGRVGPVTLSLINQQMNGDVMAPIIMNSINVSVSTRGASIAWSTNENASAVVYYSASPLSMIESGSAAGVTIGGSSVLVHTDLRASHSVDLSGLIANTTYYYVLYVRDGAGNETVTWPTTFHTNN